MKTSYIRPRPPESGAGCNGTASWSNRPWQEVGWSPQWVDSARSPFWNAVTRHQSLQIADGYPAMAACAEIRIARRVQRTAAYKVNQPLDQNIATAGCESEAVVGRRQETVT